MQIKVDCPTCGHNYSVASTMAGLKLKCRQCGATMVVTAPSERTAAVAPPPPSRHAGPAGLKDPDELSHDLIDSPRLHDSDAPEEVFDVYHLGDAASHRKRAAYLCYALAALLVLSAIIAVFFSFALGSADKSLVLPDGTIDTLNALCGVGALILAALGATYIYCATKLNGEDFRTVLLASIVAIIHAILAAEALVLIASQSSLISLTFPKFVTLSLTMGPLTLLLLIPLLYYTTRILQDRR